MSITFSGLDSTRQNPRHPRFPVSIDLDFEHPAFLNLCNANALRLLGLLGLELDGDFCGSCSVADARRAVMRARATFDRVARRFVRAEEREHGEPRQNPDGSVELRPLRLFARGLDAEDLRNRLDRFARAIEALAALGADRISWG